jgi:hypothetical protein
MTTKLRTPPYETGLSTIHAVIYSADHTQVWNGSSLVAVASATPAFVAMTEEAVNGTGNAQYAVNLPGALAETAVYDAVFYDNGVSPALTDTIIGSQYDPCNVGTVRATDGSGNALMPADAKVSARLAQVITGDTYNQLSDINLTITNPANTDNGRLYFSFADTDGTRILSLYKAKDDTGALSGIVASGSVTGDGVVTLIAQNSSGISGTVTLTYSHNSSSITILAIPEMALVNLDSPVSDIPGAVLDEAKGTHSGLLASWDSNSVALVIDKVNLLGTASVTVESPLADNLDLTIVQYDDYLTGSEHGLLTWTNEDGTWAGGNLTNSTITFTATDSAKRIIKQIAGLAVTPTGTQVLGVPLSSDDTGAFARIGKQYQYEILIEKANTRATSITGAVIVGQSLNPPDTNA